MKPETSKALGKAIGGVAEFLINWAIVKCVWDGTLVTLFPTLHPITWGQALLIIWFCEALFKARHVKVSEE